MSSSPQGRAGELRTECPCVAERSGVVVTLLDPSSTPAMMRQEDCEGSLDHKKSSRLAQVTQQPNVPGLFVSLTSHLGGKPLWRNYLDQTGPCRSFQLIPDTEPTLGGTIPWAVVLGCVRRLAEREPESAPANSVPPWPLLEFLLRLSSAMDYGLEV